MFIIAVLFAVACSTDNQEINVNDANTVNASTKRGGADLDKLYIDMANSESYINFKAASAEFAKKMKFTGNINSVNTDEKILAWVNDNIGKTGFTSYAAAAEEFETVKRLGQLAVNNNFGFTKA